MPSVFSVDGVEYSGVHVLSLSRKFSVLDRDKSGRTLSGDMKRSIIGTYYNYTLEIDASQASRATYDRLYEVLSAPQTSHSITMPYAQSTVTFNAYVSNGEDELIRKSASESVWGHLSINFIAMSPKRRSAG